MSVADAVDLDPERAWAIVVGAIATVLVGGAAIAPRLVWDRFLWHYFWGPVVADAKSAECAVKAGSGTEFLATGDACAAAEAGGIVAYPGYTVVSEIGYAVTLVLALVGVVFLLRRLDVGQERRFFYALFPFMFLGGALRVVEDALDAVPAGQETVVTFPWNTLIISPVIYFTMFFFTLAALLIAVRLADGGYVDRYETPLAALGVGALALVIGYLAYLATTTEYVRLFPQFAAVTLLAAVAITAGTYYAVERFAPVVNAGTGRMGAVVVFAHAVDGAANVVGLDFAAALTGGAYPNLRPKHPVNAYLDSVGQQFPATVQNAIGTAWPFLVVKIAAAVFVVWVFDERIFEDSPRYAILLLVAIVAVGLGPGTRDMLRAVFGV